MARFTDVDKFQAVLDAKRAETDRYHDIVKLREFSNLLALAPIEKQVRAARTGKWEMKADKGFVCSECQAAFLYATNFCGECGAEMEVSDVL